MNDAAVRKSTISRQAAVADWLQSELGVNVTLSSISAGSFEFWFATSQDLSGILAKIYQKWPDIFAAHLAITPHGRIALGVEMGDLQPNRPPPTPRPSDGDILDP